MNAQRKLRQTRRRLETMAKSAPKDSPCHELLELAVAQEQAVTEAESNAKFWEDRLSEFEQTTADQLAETRVELDNARVRGRRLEKALGEAVKIAKKDRAAGWKKATNPDFQAICECETLVEGGEEA